ncbi:MAG: PsbP-related protein [Candidatus Daviesbacteria bacterium]|nr:PsbP-related protein [Candidatus Daviesbacteria bacterium]
MPKGFAPILTVILIALMLAGGFLIYQKQIKPASLIQKTTQIPSTPSAQTDETANWKTYENKNLGISFKYPSDWNLLEYENYVGVIKDPDFRMVVGACPGYSFVIRKFDPKENYQIYQPIERSIFKDQKADIYEKVDQYGCGRKTIFINRFPTESIKPKLIISMTTKNPNSKLFDQILATFKFSENNQDQIEGKFCGGIAGNLPQNMCPAGYQCQLDGDYPDAGGKCIKK